MASPIGTRVHIIGNTNAGKSTLAAHLAQILQAPLVELDAINWQPDWVALCETEPGLFEGRVRESTAGDSWVVAGSYMGFSQRFFWPRLETVVWLDLPLPLLVYRVITRSWRRWRSGELLWGTNREDFWRQLMLWRREDSLVWWAVTRHQRKRDAMLEAMADPAWSHIRFIRLVSAEEVGRFARLTAEAVGASRHRDESVPS